MVSSSSLPDRPRRRGARGRGASGVGWSVADTNICPDDLSFGARPATKPARPHGGTLIPRMRFGPRPVKLPIANVCRFQWSCGRLFVRKNPAKTDIFAPIATFQRSTVATTPDIDENRSLPYKPRQLSAMARLFPGGGSFRGRKWPVWAGPHHRTHLNSTGKLPGQRRTTREADLSTQQTGAQAPSRLPRPSRHDRRPQGSRRAPCARSQASERLTRASPEIPSWIG